MNKETLNSYYKKSIETFEFSKVNGEAFWATVTLILVEEGQVDKDNFADCLELLSKLPAYASNMEKQMVEAKLLDEKKTAQSLADKYRQNATKNQE